MGDTRPGPGTIDPNAEPEDRLAPVREAIGGDKRAAIRRIVLYVLAFALIVSPVPVAAVVPLALLAMTDVLA